MTVAQTLEDEAKGLNDALYAILRWDTDNVIPDELHEQARAALKPQFAPAAINAKLLAACETALEWSLNQPTPEDPDLLADDKAYYAQLRAAIAKARA